MWSRGTLRPDAAGDRPFRRREFAQLAFSDGTEMFQHDLAARGEEITDLLTALVPDGLDHLESFFGVFQFVCVLFPVEPNHLWLVLEVENQTFTERCHGRTLSLL